MWLLISLLGLIVCLAIGFWLRSFLNRGNASAHISESQKISDKPITYSLVKLASLAGETTLTISPSNITEVAKGKTTNLDLSEITQLDYTPIINKVGKPASKANYLLGTPGMAYANMRYISLFGKDNKPLLQIQYGGWWKNEPELIYNLITLARNKNIPVSDKLMNEVNTRYPKLFA